MILAGAVAVLLCAAPLAAPTPAANAPWDSAVLSGDPGAMLRAARALPPAAADTETDILLEDETVSFDAEGGRVKTYRIVFRPLTDAAAQAWGVMEMRWNPWRTQRPELRARVIASETEVYTLDPATIEDAAASSDDDAVFQDDRMARAPLPAMKKGVLAEEVFVLREREAAPGAGFMSRIYLGHRRPVRQLRVSLDAPAALPLRTRVLGMDAHPSERVEHGRRHLELALGPVAPLPEVEELLPVEVAPWPHLSYATGRSWKEVAAAYAKLAAPQLSAASPLWPEVAALQKKKAPRAEIVRAATAELHRLTRYTGVEFGDGAMVPRAPEQVLQRRYGDCKDLSTLLVAQLREAGVRAQLVLLRAGGEDVESDLPGLGAFDHAIVRVQGNPALWVDPTAPGYAPGLLPTSDQGRFALVVDAHSPEVVRTPIGEESVDREEREILLAEMGPGRVRITVESTGVLDALRRDALQPLDPAARRKLYVQFATESYGAKDLASFSTTDPLDFSHPLRVTLEAAEAAKVDTGVMGIDLRLERAPLFRRAPDALRANRAEGDPPQQARVHDLELPAPYRSELRYRVVLPPGFTVREIPAAATEQLGPATLRERFAQEKDGALTAEYQLDLTHRRWTAAEVNAFRAAVDRLYASPLVVHIDQHGKSLIAAGHLREGLEALRALAALHPKEALHHRQLATALLDAGAGEEARAEARRAVELGPEEVTSHTVAGYVLEHDLLGREFRKGFDWAGALAEFRRAKELDAKNEYARVQLTNLYERGPSGRYLGADARLDEAIAEYQAMRRDLQRHKDDERLLNLLWLAQRIEDARSLAREMPSGAERNAKLVAAAAATGGLQAAVDEADRLGPEERKPALLGAGQALLTIGRLDPAADLLEKGMDAAKDSSKTRALIAALRRLGRREPEPAPDDPRSLARQLTRLVFRDDVTAAQVRSFYWRHLRERDEKKGDRSPLWTSFENQRAPLRKIRLAALEAITLAMTDVTAEGDPKRGWRVRMRNQFDSTGGGTMYVIEEDGRARIVCDNNYSCPPEQGAVAMQMVQAGDLEGARRWLDWATETLAPPPSDPDEPTFYRAFWTAWSRDGKRGLDEARLAASVLVAGLDVNPVAKAVLSKAMETAAPRQRGYLQFSLATLLSNGDDLPKALAAADEAAKQFPESQNASELRLMLLQEMSRWADITRHVKARLERHPTDWHALSAGASAAVMMGDFDTAEGWLHKEIEVAPDHEANALNALAWQDLCRNRVTDATLANAQRASALAGDNYAILNTLAAVDAAAGKAAEARRLLRKTIEQTDEDQLSPADWLVVGLLAEADGLPRTALAAYGKIQSRKDESPLSSSTVARRREAALRAAAK